MGASDLHVSVDSSKPRCVLDPALALGHAAGPRVAHGLTRVFETWLTRWFWQVLDASELLAHAAPARATAAPDPAALADWLALRDGTDAGSWRLRWIGDCLAESQLRGSVEEPLLERYEWLAAGLQALDEQAGVREGWCAGLDPWRGALDTLALSATLEGALVLCPWGPGEPAPLPAQALARCGLPVTALASGDEGLFAAERAVVREGLARAGLVPQLQRLGRLAVVHALAAPAAGLDAEGEPGPAGPWQGAQLWWYAL